MTKRFAGVALAAGLACGWASGAEASIFVPDAGRFTFLLDIHQEVGERPLTKGINIQIYSEPLYPSNDVISSYASASNSDHTRLTSSVISALYTSYLDFTSPSSSQFSITTSNGLTNFSMSISTMLYLNYFENDYAYSTAGYDSYGYEQAEVEGVQPYFLNVSAQLRGNSLLSLSYESTFGNGDTSDLGSLDSIDFVLTQIGPVPLPASAPLFGAALLGLGALGYGMRRKRGAAELS